MFQISFQNLDKCVNLYSINYLKILLHGWKNIPKQSKKLKIKVLLCLFIPDPLVSLIVETNVQDICYGGILKQKLDDSPNEQIVRFHYGIWNDTKKNYSTIEKEILSIILCIIKFQDVLFNKKFLLRIDCKSTKDVLEKEDLKS